MSAELLEAVRKACRSALWSQGVKLAREGKVVFSSRGAAEAVARVRAPGHAIAPTVTLFVEDAEWSCDCGDELDPCSHVAAAAIALAGAPSGPQADDAARPAEASAEALRAIEAAERPHAIRYDFSIKNAGLWLERHLVAPDGREALMTLSLTDRIARGVRTPPLEPTHEDLGVDRALAGKPRAFVTATVTAFVLRSLEGAAVRFEGAPVRTRGEPVLPRATLRSARDGVELEVLPAPEVARVPAPLVALTTDGELRPLGATDLFGTRHESLPLRRFYGPAQLAEVSAKVLPELERQLAVDVRTTRLPGLDRSLRPRLALEVLEDGVHDLTVLPLLVYGDPPVARVDGATLAYVGPRGGTAPRRDEARERELVAALRDELHLVPSRRLELDGAEAASFLARLRDFERRHGLGAHAAFVEAPLVPRLRFGAATLDVAFETEPDPESGEIRRASPEAVARSLRAELAYVPLEGGGFARLPADWLHRHGAALLDLLAARRDDGTLAPHALPELRALADDVGAHVPPPTEALGALLEGFAGRIARAELPADLRAELRGYQREAVDWLSFLRGAGCGGVLADDMGLGKTLETLAALRGRTLVVCPRSVVWTWEAEAARFRPGLRTCVFHGPKRALDRAADVVITTYAILRLDQATLAAEAWDAVVLDEAQNVKNPGSQSARAAFELRAPFRLALTGTPIENRLSELWSLLHFALPGLLGGLRDFQDRYEEPIGRGDAAALARLRARTKPFILRRTKAEVARDLPPRTEVVELVELDEAERETYEAVLAATKRDLLARVGEDASVMQVLEALLRLRQAACHAGLVPGRAATSSSKVDRLVEMLVELASEGHRALVFSQWTSLLDRVEPHLAEQGLRFERLDGSTRDRAGVVARFQSPDGPPVMLLSLKAGGAGLTLTAADHVFLLDPWWNPAVEDQAADRAHRIGQERPVLIHRLVAKETVEERVLRLGEKKRALAIAALEGAEGAAAVTREDLLELLA